MKSEQPCDAISTVKTSNIKERIVGINIILIQRRNYVLVYYLGRNNLATDIKALMCAYIFNLGLGCSPWGR